MSTTAYKCFVEYFIPLKTLNITIPYTGPCSTPDTFDLKPEVEKALDGLKEAGILNDWDVEECADGDTDSDNHSLWLAFRAENDIGDSWFKVQQALQMDDGFTFELHKDK